MPDSSIMLDLCELLSINVNELLKGEKITMENYGKAAEEMLLELRRREEQRNKLMLRIEVLMASVCVIASLINLMVAVFASINRFPQILLIMTATVLLVIAVFVALKIEQDAGYYVCKHCNHHYQPTYMGIIWAPHLGRTRYMKCPNCGKKSWQKKCIGYEAE